MDNNTLHLVLKKQWYDLIEKCKGITVGKGNTEWGAEKDKQYFVIKLGDRII